MKIGIIGTRGIPNNYGGFEQFAEYFSTLMMEKGHDITVYASHKHPYKSNNYKGVKIVKCFDPEYKIGTAGQFIYDLNCILHSRKQNFDIILQLGYTSSTVWWRFMPKKSVVVTNMDGLEWKREKYNAPTRFFLKYAEKLAVNHSNYLIADSVGIQQYLQKKYNVSSTFIPYGAHLFDTNSASEEIIIKYGISANNYDLVIARFEPENSIEIILRAYMTMPENALVLVGNYESTKFGKRMFRLFSGFKNIVFLGPVFDKEKLDNLRYFSRLYLHGHTVGGTNPSLLEAMACNALICAHDNIFNRSVLNDNALYFSSTHDINGIASTKTSKHYYEEKISENRQKISQLYNWENITNQLEQYFINWMNETRG